MEQLGRPFRYLARRHKLRLLLGVPYLLLAVSAATAASHRTQNFIVTADNLSAAQQIAAAAEAHRRALSLQWFQVELTAWSEPCPIQVLEVQDAPAHGQTSFTFAGGRPTDWRMSLKGPYRKILDSVLPHEIAHTVFATYFGRPLPRWLEEGVCVAVEHPSSRTKLERTVVETLRTGNGILLERMFKMNQYPQDIPSFYSQGYSLTLFLIQHGGEQKLVRFITAGINSDDWVRATREHYGYQSLTDLQRAWTKWVLSSA